VSGIQHALGQLLVGNALAQQLGYELLRQSRRAEPHPGLDPGVLVGELRPKLGFTDGSLGRRDVGYGSRVGP